jgi:tetratricopeptide (TPR) repeat protein
MAESSRKNRPGRASADPRQASHTSTDGGFDRPVPGSIADVVGRLEIWGRLAATGLARIAFTSEYARQHVVDELRAAFKAAAVAFYEVDLAPNTPALDIVRQLKARYRTLEPGVVSLSGLTAALPFDHTDLVNALHVLNYNRENLAVHPLRQIWWMSTTLADEFTRNVPDINSWFIVKETLIETVPRPAAMSDEIFQRPSDAPSVNIDQARRHAEYMVGRFNAALKAGAPLEDLRWLASASVRALKEGGAEAEALTLLIEMLDAERLAYPHVDQPVRDLFTNITRSVRPNPPMRAGNHASSSGAELSDGSKRATDEDMSLILRAVRKESEAAADVIVASAFLAFKRIPQEIFTRGAEEFGAPLDRLVHGAANHPEVLDEMYSHLADRLLIVRDQQDRSFDIPVLVQQLVFASVPAAERRAWIERVVGALVLAHPGYEFSNWPECERLLPHWLVCAELVEKENIGTRETGIMLTQAASYLYERARYAEAEPLFVRALVTNESLLGPAHPVIAASLNNLAEVYGAQGRYAEAESMHVRALAINERAFGCDHPDTARSLNNLAHVYANQGRFSEAEPMYIRALAINEGALGSDHPDTATSLNNLANLYASQGRYAEAEPLHLRALAVDERVLGPDHLATATDMSNLATAYYLQRKYAEAEPLYARAFAIRAKALGLGHPQTVSSIERYANLLTAIGRDDEAAALRQRATGNSENGK